MTQPSRLDAAIEEQTTTDQQWFRSPLALVAGLILFGGVLALIVLSVTGGDDTASSPTDVGVQVAAEPPVEVEPVQFGGPDIPEVDTVVITGDVLPRLVPDQDDPAVGTRAPDITATSLGNGNPITLSSGRARVIGFFAHWCPHCQAELPEITEWLAANRLPPNTEFIAVSTAVDEGSGNYPPSAWFTDVGFSSPVLVDDADSSLLSGLGFSGFPAFIAIDASGTVVGRAGGNIGTEGLEELFANFAR